MPAPKKQEEEMEKRGWIPVRVAAERLHVSIGTIYRAIESGMLVETLVTGRKYVSLDSFRTYAGVLAEPAVT